MVAPPSMVYTQNGVSPDASLDAFLASSNRCDHGSVRKGLTNSAACRRATLRLTACPLYRCTRPSLCSISTGLAGKFQCITAWQYVWKSRPSWPTDVVASTNGQNGELKALRT